MKGTGRAAEPRRDEASSLTHFWGREQISYPTHTTHIGPLKVSTHSEAEAKSISTNIAAGEGDWLRKYSSHKQNSRTFLWLTRRRASAAPTFPPDFPYRVLRWRFNSIKATPKHL